MKYDQKRYKTLSMVHSPKNLQKYKDQSTNKGSIQKQRKGYVVSKKRYFYDICVYFYVVKKTTFSLFYKENCLKRTFCLDYCLKYAKIARAKCFAHLQGCH